MLLDVFNDEGQREAERGAQRRAEKSTLKRREEKIYREMCTHWRRRRQPE